MMGRISRKLRQIRTFYRHSATPLALSLDVLRLKRRPFVAVTRDGLKVEISPGGGESFTFYEIVLNRDYFRGGVTLKPGDTVVDVGSNIGCFSILAGSMVGPSGRVIAFDPMPPMLERLVANARLNDLRNVQGRCVAIDEKEGTLTLRWTHKNDRASAYMLDGPTLGTTTSPCWTMDQVFRECRIDRINLLKIDCEGSEYGIFESLSPESAGRIDQIAMEVHPMEGKSPEALRRRLEELGFEIIQLGYPWIAMRRDRPA